MIVIHISGGYFDLVINVYNKVCFISVPSTFPPLLPPPWSLASTPLGLSFNKYGPRQKKEKVPEKQGPALKDYVSTENRIQSLSAEFYPVVRIEGL